MKTVSKILFSLFCLLAFIALGSVVVPAHAFDLSTYVHSLSSDSLLYGGSSFAFAVAAKNNHRAVFNAMKQKYPSAIITDSYLRMEASIQGTFNQIQFSVLQNQPPINNTERRLAITDRFCVTQMGLFLMKAGTSTTATQAQIAGAGLRTWPNPQVFTGAAEAVALQNIYNGFMQVKIDSTTYFDSLDLMRFYRVPVSQQGVAYIAAGPALNQIQRDGWDILNYGYCPIDPTFEMSGRGKNDLSLQLPVSVDLSGTSTQNFAVLITRGFLMQNAAKNS